MKQHTTNYFNTFILIAEDSNADSGMIPPAKGENRTAAQIQFENIAHHPYKYTSDDILFQVFAEKNDISESDLEKARMEFFSKGQPCFRASPLTKSYGFGVHSDDQGRIAIYGCETEAYQKLANDKNIKVLKAMKSKRG